MSAGRAELARLAGFGLVTLVFAVTQPFVLVGLPLALMLFTFGPLHLRSAVVVTAVVLVSALGDRAGLWWFERGWPLVLAGMFVWTTGWRPAWGFFARALAALAMAAVVVTLIFVIHPTAWSDVDALMAARAGEAAQRATSLLGDRMNEAAQGVVPKIVGLQVAVFPALLAVSSLGALGVAAAVRGWLSGEAGSVFGGLRSFRFNDHLVWLLLGGLVLILAPVGAVGDRVGGNVVLFMGLLYVLRGMAVVLTLVGGVSVIAGVLGGLAVLIVYPILALLVLIMLLVGLSDTWLNVRDRVRARRQGV